MKCFGNPFPRSRRERACIPIIPDWRRMFSSLQGCVFTHHFLIRRFFHEFWGFSRHEIYDFYTIYINVVCSPGRPKFVMCRLERPLIKRGFIKGARMKASLDTMARDKDANQAYWLVSATAKSGFSANWVLESFNMVIQDRRQLYG